MLRFLGEVCGFKMKLVSISDLILLKDWSHYQDNTNRSGLKSDTDYNSIILKTLHYSPQNPNLQKMKLHFGDLIISVNLVLQLSNIILNF